MITTVAARRLFDGEEVLEYPLVGMEDGQITSITSLLAEEHVQAVATHRFAGATLAPAYIDVHIHGSAGHDVMEASRDALDAIGAFLATRGVGAYFPTTVTSSGEETLRALAGLGREIRRRQMQAPAGAVPLGIHLEGPFLSHARRGVHVDSLLEVPSLERFDRFWQASEGQIRLLTIAPELPGATELIAYATGLGVRCSLGHSDATVEEAQAALDAGACSATHTFNAMRRIDHRDPGLAALVMDRAELFAELICDGIHVDPMLVRLLLKAKGERRLLLVTDGISATGMPDGTYRLGEMQVEVRNGRCSSGGALAGSVLTLDRAVRNLVEFTGASLQTAVAAASRNPSLLMGLGESWGGVHAGMPANFTVLSREAEVMQTFLAGRPVL